MFSNNLNSCTSRQTKSNIHESSNNNSSSKMSNTTVLNWGIVSAGYISSDFCSAVRSLKSQYHRLQAVAARKLTDAQQFAATHGIAAAYDTYEALFASAEVNIVYIGAVNHTHKELCLKAIAAGKHVLCEKPMSLSVADQEEVLRAAKEQRVFFMEALWTRFFPLVQRLKEELHVKKSVGDQVNFFVSNFMVPIKDVERLKRKDLGGGALLDIGIYPIQLACLVFEHEKPIKITATGHLMATGVDECCSLTLLFPNQRIAQINISISCQMFAPTFIVGEKGHIQIPKMSWCPLEMILASGEVVREEISGSDEFKTHFDNSLGLRYQAEAVRDAIAKGDLEHPFVTHDNSRLIMSIIDEAKTQLGYTSY